MRKLLFIDSLVRLNLYQFYRAFNFSQVISGFNPRFSAPATQTWAPAPTPANRVNYTRVILSVMLTA